VLCYHRVAELPRDPFNCCVSAAHFAEHLEVLGNRNLVPAFGQLADSYQPGRVPADRRVILTFDDGYADNFQVAAPLLQRRGLHAIFYIFTGWIERCEEAWWDRIESLVLAAASLPPVLRLPGIEGGFATANRAALLAALHVPLRNASASQRETILAGFPGASNAPEVRPAYRPLTVAELRDLAAQPGVHIGAHTASHAFLPTLTPREQQLEITSSREWLEQVLDRPVRDLAYPHGGESADTRAAAVAAGMHTAVTCEARCTRRGDDPFGIPRVMVHDWDGDEFARRLEWWFSH
jgi:peptidoglycan/xylan/chitin deacetylase (PgdA/CDA1 family)